MTESDTLLGIGFAELITQHGKTFVYKGKPLIALESDPTLAHDFAPRGFAHGMEFDFCLSFKRKDFDDMEWPGCGDTFEGPTGKKHRVAGVKGGTRSEFILVYLNLKA